MKYWLNEIVNESGSHANAPFNIPAFLLWRSSISLSGRAPGDHGSDRYCLGLGIKAAAEAAEAFSWT